MICEDENENRNDFLLKNDWDDYGMIEFWLEVLKI